MEELFAEIVVFSALEKTLHYRIPPELRSQAQVGKRVIVPLGRREAPGLLLEVDECHPPTPAGIRIRPILAVIDQLPVVSADLLKICRWVSEYYFHPLGEVLKVALPSGIQSTSAIHFRLTDAGREAVQLADSPDLLEILSHRGQMTLAELEAGLSSPGTTRRGLRDCEARGLVERFFVWQPPPAGPKTVRTARLIRSPDTRQPAKNPNRQSLIDFLQRAEGGPVPLKDLRKEIRNLDYWLKRLHQEGAIALEEMQEFRDSNLAQSLPPAAQFDLTAEQTAAFDEVRPHIRAQGFRPFLVHGVTGSGKTELYIRLIAEALKLDRGALVLVPEIALSTQMEALFRQRFGAQLAVWHSGLADGARHDQWQELLAGRRKVLLGARSAVFMPVANLGLIIVDEEHDPSYKQEDRLRYHARDVALMRASILHIPVLLGSATPSLQSFSHAAGNRYRGIVLSRRIFDRPLPDLQVVDMRRESGKSRILSVPLQRALAETVEKGEQALLFLNRRGFATFLLCHVCGYVLQCAHCSVSLTYHQQEDHLRCHYCGSMRATPACCPVCGNAGLILHGFGTERVAEEVRKLLPAADTVRIDRDTVNRPEDLLNYLNTFRNCQASILIGTQMIAKGHDFPNVTLVGIVNADTALQIADFRAGETTVQLLMQVAGRSGRGEKPGRVILQTYNPGHYTIQAVMQMDYELFCRHELVSRKELQYPPFTRLAKLMVTAASEPATRTAAHQLASLCRTVAQELRQRNRPVAILGPAAAPLLKLKRRYRWQIFAKAWTNQDLHDFAAAVLERAKLLKDLRRVRLSIDRDPITTV